jgi:hypothetical protein
MKELYRFKDDEEVVDIKTTRHAIIVITNKALYLEYILNQDGRPASNVE